MFQTSRHLAVIACFMAPALAGVGCRQDTSPQRFEVKGTVYVEGTPAQGMLVQLLRKEAGTGNDQYPSCMSDEQGKFQFGSPTCPGLIEGTYVATFAWLEGKDLAAKDKLQGKFADDKKSNFVLKVPSNELSDIKFDLKQSK